jgi:hypothetical protein
MSHIESVEAIYDAFGRGDIPAILERLAEDVEWEQEMSTGHGIPYLLPGRGRRHVQEFFESLAAIELTRFEPFSFLSNDTQVVCLVRATIRNRRTGKSFDDLEAHLWGFDAKGRVNAFRHLADTHAHWLANQG